MFDETITEEDEKTGPGNLEFEKDDLYDEAARIVVSSGQVSISYLQRKLRIGFSRAARLLDMMEAVGLVSPGALALDPSTAPAAAKISSAPRAPVSFRRRPDSR